jgi:transposase
MTGCGDLLPDRTADRLAGWLKQHPLIEIIVRDRAGAYANGASQGAPEARQVADRRHLLRNGSDALRDLLHHYHRDLREAAQAVGTPTGELVLETAAQTDSTALCDTAPRSWPMTMAQRHSLDAQQRRDARFKEAVRLREQGLSITATARAVGVERKTLRRWLRAGHAPTWRHADRGRSLLDPFRSFLERRWTEGCHSASALWRELREQGLIGQVQVVRQWAAQHRRAQARVGAESAAKPTPPKVVQPPTPRKAVRLLMSQTDTLGEADRQFVTTLLGRSVPIARAVELTRRFSAMVKDHQADQLDGWLADAEAGGLKTFAHSLRQDYNAVYVALTESWSTGPVEGDINRLKTIKRAMSGRASVDLLRSRVLAPG